MINQVHQVLGIEQFLIPLDKFVAGGAEAKDVPSGW